MKKGDTTKAAMENLLTLWERTSTPILNELPCLIIYSHNAFITGRSCVAVEVQPFRAMVDKLVIFLFDIYALDKTLVS